MKVFVPSNHTTARQSVYISSPSYRKIRNELLGWLGLFAFMVFLVIVAGLTS